MSFDACSVMVKLQRHMGPRRLGVRVDDDTAPTAHTGARFPHAHAPAAAVQAFVEALRDGVPRLEADTTQAAIVSSQSTSMPSGRSRHHVEVLLPPCAPQVVGVLANLLAATAQHRGVKAVAIEELADAVGTGATILEEYVYPLAPLSFGPTPFPFHRSRSREVIKMGTLEVRFAADLGKSLAMDLERWTRAWFALVAAGGFLVREIGAHSFAKLTEVSDAYPDEWVFHFEHLLVDDLACGPLLDRLSDIHAATPITHVEIG